MYVERDVTAAKIEELINDGADKDFSVLTEQEWRSEYQESWGDYIPLEDSFDTPPETDKNTGFTFVDNDTWIPTSLYEARERKRRWLARGSKRSIVWTR